MKTKSTTKIIIGLVIVIAIGCLVVTTPKKSSNTRSSPPASTKTMYACGYDRCKDSGEYGTIIYQTGINVWNNPDPNRGGVHHQLNHGNRVQIVNQRRVDGGPGGLWYQLDGGGWINDLWVTEQQCNVGNLAANTFTDCLMGEY